MTNLSGEVEKSLIRIAGSDSLVIAELSLKGMIYYSLNNGVDYKRNSKWGMYDQHLSKDRR
jgi:hypothetical protein